MRENNKMNVEECRTKIKDLKVQDEIIIAEIRMLNLQKMQLQNYKNDSKESLKIQELKTQVKNKKYTVDIIRESIKYLVELESLISSLDDKKIGTCHMNYLNFSTNDHVYIPNEGITGILLYECKEPLNTWSVLIRKINKMIIRRVHINQIRPYENSCWNCGTGLNGIRDSTCPQCHWTHCPKCGKCRRPICIDNNIIIEDSLNVFNPSSGFNPPNGFNSPKEFTPQNSFTPTKRFNTQNRFNPPMEFSNTNWSNTQNEFNSHSIVDDDSEVVDGF